MRILLQKGVTKRHTNSLFYDNESTICEEYNGANFPPTPVEAAPVLVSSRPLKKKKEKGRKKIEEPETATLLPPKTDKTVEKWRKVGGKTAEKKRVVDEEADDFPKFNRL